MEHNGNFCHKFFLKIIELYEQKADAIRFLFIKLNNFKEKYPKLAHTQPNGYNVLTEKARDSNRAHLFILREQEQTCHAGEGLDRSEAETHSDSFQTSECCASS